MNWIEFFVLILVLIAVIISSFLINSISNELTKITGYDNSSKLQSARLFYDFAAVFTWASAVVATSILVIFMIQSSYSNIHRHNYGTHGYVRIALWLLLIFLFIGGILLFFGYNEMRSTATFTQRNDPDDSINNFAISSMIIIGASILAILIIIVTMMFRKPKPHLDEQRLLAEEVEQSGVGGHTVVEQSSIGKHVEIEQSSMGRPVVIESPE